MPLYLPSGLFASGFQTEVCTHLSSLRKFSHIQSLFMFLDFYHLIVTEDTFALSGIKAWRKRPNCESKNKKNREGSWRWLTPRWLWI